MSITIATAPCCWGVDDVTNPDLPPWERVFDEAAAAGYGGIELGPYGYVPLDAGRVGEPREPPAPDRRDLRPGHAAAEGAALAGPALPHPVSHGHGLGPRRARLCGRPSRPRAAPRRRGLGRHGGDDPRHRRAGARPAWRPRRDPPACGWLRGVADEIARVARDVPAAAAGFCLDTGHLFYAGIEPVSEIERYADRLDYIHFKDIDIRVLAEVMGERIRFFEACARGVMCPIGRGAIDCPAIRACLDRLGYAGFVTVEQERDPRNAGGSLTDVRASRDYLRGAGF